MSSGEINVCYYRPRKVLEIAWATELTAKEITTFISKSE